MFLMGLEKNNVKRRKRTKGVNSTLRFRNWIPSKKARRGINV